mmetsp:Transcript_32332/g.82123  ORF Transcript_32332/g.82123 Transcript_32332/m.82123 type:complete len:162 (-) Transcript_32332:416-901(-)
MHIGHWTTSSALTASAVLLLTAVLGLHIYSSPGRAHASMATPATGAGAAAAGGSDTGAIVVYCTVPNQEVADKLSGVLVEGKLAACVNIVPGLTSVYWWDGKVNRDAELLLVIKTRASLLGELTAAIKSNHPYDEPEVISLPITGGSPSYLAWLLSSTKAG